MASFFHCHAAVASCGRGTGNRRATAKRFLRLRRQRPETHTGNGDRNIQFDRVFGKLGAEYHLGPASLPIAFEGIARHGGAEKQ